MGLLRKMGIALSMVAAQVGLAGPPVDDAARLAKMESMYEGYRADFATVPEVTAAELKGMLEGGEVVLVDVRSEAERGVSTIPGSISKEAFDPKAAEGKVVVAYCTIGYRSGEWAEARRAEGVDARNFRGSVLAWSHIGGPFVTPAGEPTNKVHVYGAQWDLLRNDYTSVY